MIYCSISGRYTSILSVLLFLVLPFLRCLLKVIRVESVSCRWASWEITNLPNRYKYFKVVTDCSAIASVKALRPLAPAQNRQIMAATTRILIWNRSSSRSSYGAWWRSQQSAKWSKRDGVENWNRSTGLSCSSAQWQDPKLLTMKNDEKKSDTQSS